MTYSTGSKSDVVQCVEETLRLLPNDSPWTMTITQGRYGDYSVRTVIATSSDAIDEAQVAKFFSATQVNT